MQVVLPGPVLTVTLIGQFTITGLVLSKNATLNVHVLELPFTSVTVSVNGKLLIEALITVPAGMFCVTLAIPQASVAFTLKVKSGMVVVQFVPLYKVVSAKQVITGGVLSTTVTTAVQEDKFPFASLTTSVTVLGPTLAQVNVLGVTLTKVVGVQLSELPLST